MAIFHMVFKICSRAQGKSAIANAAYISGEKIKSDYDGKIYDFSKKKGVVYSGIFLPPNVSNIDKYRDRKVLWNAVEKIEKGKRAQLARTIEASLPRELSLPQQIKLTEDFLRPFAEKGMCVDYSIHDMGDGNPHFHALLTIRPLKPDGSWGDKSHKIYLLDESGNKIYDKKKRQYKCRSERTTDWDKRENVEIWRKQWTELTNKILMDNGLNTVIDHRSYERQGLYKLPQISYSKEELALEKKGVKTVTSNINSMIDDTNRLITSISNSLFTLAYLTSEEEEEEKRKRRRP